MPPWLKLLAHSANSPRPYSNSPAAWARLITAMSDVAREQRITNLIVRSQITRGPVEKTRLMSEASGRMDAPRRRSPHDFL